MSELTVQIVKIKGEGAGVSSIREVPLDWWNNANKPNSGLEKDVADWKIIPKTGYKADPIIEPQKTPDEIMQEAIAKVSPYGVKEENPIEVESAKKIKKSEPKDVKI